MGMATGLSREKLSSPRSPEQLDRSIRITSSREWMATLFIALVGMAAAIWSVFGTLDTRVTGLGMVLPDGGKVFTASVANGGLVTKILVRNGDRVSKGDKLLVLQQVADDLNLSRARADLEALQNEEKITLERSRKLIDRRKQASDELVASYKTKIQTLDRRLNKKLRQLSDLQADVQKGFVTRDALDSSQSEIDDLRFQLIDLKEKIADAHQALAEFVAGQEVKVEERSLAARKQEIEVERLLSLEKADEIVFATADGVVAELEIAVGDVLSPGQAAVNILSGDSSIAVESFFRASDGKRIVPGMKALVAVSSAEAAIYGKAIGEVVEVSRLPVTAAFIEDRIGNKELVSSLMADGAPIHVRIRFKPDAETISGVAWTSFKGPPFKIDAGTLATSSVTVSSQPPINYVAPLFEEHIGLSEGQKE